MLEKAADTTGVLFTTTRSGQDHKIPFVTRWRRGESELQWMPKQSFRGFSMLIFLREIERTNTAIDPPAHIIVYIFAFEPR